MGQHRGGKALTRLRGVRQGTCVALPRGRSGPSIYARGRSMSRSKISSIEWQRRPEELTTHSDHYQVFLDHLRITNLFTVGAGGAATKEEALCEAHNSATSLADEDCQSFLPIIFREHWG